MKLVNIKEQNIIDGNNRKLIYFSVLAIMIAAALIYYNSFDWNNGNIAVKRAVVIIIISLCVLVIPFLCVRIRPLSNSLNSLVVRIVRIPELVKSNWKTVVTAAAVYIAAIPLAYGINCILASLWYDGDFNSYRFYLVIAVLWILTTIVLMRKNAYKRPEVLFFVLVMICGSFFIKVSPAVTGVSWDDQIHYKNTLDLANCINGVMYKTDWKMIKGTGAKNPLPLDRNTKKTVMDSKNKSYEKKKVVKDYEGSIGIHSVAYIPSAIGIVLAKGLSLSFSKMFMMGKFFNLLAYALLVFFAIRKVKNGKILIAVIGLIPTTVFVAASYSYDSWVIGFTILGYACLFSEIQSSDKKLEVKDLICIPLIFVVGLMPKVVYFPLLLPLLFMPKAKFNNVKQRRTYYLIIILLILLLILPMLLPMLTDTNSIVDDRGGTNVSASEQIEFILSNPVRYIGILLTFLKVYLALENSLYYTQYFAYLGYGVYAVMLLLTLFVVAFLDRNPDRVKYKGIRITTFIGVLGCVILVPTAFYIVFTDVGADTVMGCQFRYLLPVLFPFLYCIGADGINYKVNKNLIVIIPMMIFAFVFLSNINALCVSLY